MITIKIRKHEAVDDTGSYEVYFSDGRPSIYAYWDEVPGRRMRPEILTRNQGLEQARRIARAEATKLGSGAHS
ncbi:hypothetical protein ABIB06_007748 [Bradyrhizobium sp. LB8.2]|uniref:hypothetical protein n=1 Tax=unclassified Bradyrhizobium TaxID=2631580 RepID=UPI003398D3DA